MKKMITILLALIVGLCIYKEQKNDSIIIPNSAIRLRVIPNSNSSLDQSMKIKVKKYLEDNTYLLLKDEDDINDARKIIKDNIINIEDDVKNIFEENDYKMDYNVDYGYHYFPKKEYRNITYEEGYYESLVISIGSAEGDNWWCVLFPNLCLADLEKKEDTEYKSWILEQLNKIF